MCTTGPPADPRTRGRNARTERPRHSEEGEKRGLPTNTYGLSPLALHPGTHDPRSPRRQGRSAGDGATGAQSRIDTRGRAADSGNSRPGSATVQRRRSVTVRGGCSIMTPPPRGSGLLPNTQRTTLRLTRRIGPAPPSRRPCLAEGPRVLVECHRSSNRAMTQSGIDLGGIEEGRVAVARGVIRWFNGEKGFGFIAPDDGGRRPVRRAHRHRMQQRPRLPGQPRGGIRSGGGAQGAPRPPGTSAVSDDPKRRSARFRCLSGGDCCTDR